MFDRIGRRLAVGVLAVWLLGPARAGAWPLGWGTHDCPPPSYSCLHYWTPTLYRCVAMHRTPHLMVAPLRYPEVPNTYKIVPYHCPPVPPAVDQSTYTPPRIESAVPASAARAPQDGRSAEARKPETLPEPKPVPKPGGEPLPKPRPLPTPGGATP
jgi:hypothetical protein